MDKPSKTAVIERDEAALASEIERDQELATQALDEIRGAERLSGFGRFANKMQSIFQGQQAQASNSTGHLRVAPIMMSAGVLLLIATGLLYLFSKPESTVPSHFRQPTGLSEADTQKRAAGAADAQAPVTENQLISSDKSASTEQKKAGLQNGNGSRDMAAMRHLGVAGDQGSAGTQNIVSPQTMTNELQTPATVFVARISAAPAATSPNASPQPGRQSQLPAGTEIVAHTTNAISSGLESPVIAVVDRNVELNDSVVIPQGARVVGYTSGAVKDRINVRFTSILLPNNREMTISGLALMKDGSAGLVGKAQGSGHPVLSTAARIGTGAAVVATEFVGQGSLNQAFSQADYLRNQMAAEVAVQGNRLSNRLQQPMSVPIVNVSTNQPLRIFLLNAIDLGGGRNQGSQSAASSAFASAMQDQNAPSEQSLVAAQTAYIQALEAQLADMRAALNGKQTNGQH
ncbi:MAG TPA: TrbI/VirB10 family protein [Terriglobales bacterium]|nr:TrbI/VirB10 family protein [Terriglobales bacterium]